MVYEDRRQKFSNFSNYKTTNLKSLTISKQKLPHQGKLLHCLKMSNSQNLENSQRKKSVLYLEEQ
jgi:hypothetical protein